MKKIILIAIMTISSMTIAQTSPKHEFRASWVSTAYRLDFPRSNWSTNSMLSEITQMLDSLKNNGFNAVIFQVRPGCDAFYESAYEPWSHELTGTSGAAPSPYYDPLQTWVEEAHARNMELHAWFNPYRVSTRSNTSSLHSSHVYHQHPEWLLSVGTMAGVNQEDPVHDPHSGSRDLRESLILDPGKAAVREYVINVFLDVVNNYDVDGVHMDDYFYPYGGMSGEDAGTFAAEPRGFSDITDWRRDNVNLLVEGIYDSIQVVKPWVKYGVSPFGIWKNNVPEGIAGTSSYHELYCDPVAWLEAGTIDYLTPQLYWEHDGPQDYGLLMPWWAGQTASNNRHLYPGLAPYRLTDWHDWAAAELPRQVRLNRETQGCQGSVYFRLRNGVVNNPKGFLDSLDNDLYRYPALIPPMAWKDETPPLAPQDFQYDMNSELSLVWSAPMAASDNDLAYKYVIYGSSELPVDVSTNENILAILDSSVLNYSIPFSTNLSYAITALDRIGNESQAIQAAPLAVDVNSRPQRTTLLANYPNPFNPSTVIRYELAESANVQVTILDITGRQIATLVSDNSPAGINSVIWDGRNDLGVQVSAGVYLCRMRTSGLQFTNKIVYLR